MLDILRDPLWQFVGAFLALVAILTRPRRRALSYHVIEDTTLLDIDERIAARVVARFDGKAVKNVRSIQIRVINVGHSEIKSTEYEEPVALDFERGARVLQVKVVDVSPAHLRPIVDIAKNRMLLRPLLLHAGEFVTLKILVSGSKQLPQVTSRIIGVPEITNYLSSNSAGWYWRQLQGNEFRALLRAWSILPALFGLMGLLGMIQVRDGSWFWLWAGFLGVWYSILAFFVLILFASVPLIIRPLKRRRVAQ